jgi:Ca2+-binding RTX toxin-like protein
MSAEFAPVAAAPLPAFSGVFVFGDSLLDPGNDLRAAKALDAFPFVGLPSGAPTADKGYFEGRFTDGYNFADLISNKLIAQPTAPTFPYGFKDPVFGLSIPFVNRPEGNNLSFAYGGAKAVENIPDPAPSLPDQTDIYKNFTADPNALYVISIGANDILDLVPKSGDPVVGAAAQSRLSEIARTITQEAAQLFGQGARHVVVADIPDVGIVPWYTGVADEAMRRGLLTQYAQTADAMLKADLASLTLPAGATLLDYDFFGWSDSATSDPAAHTFTNVTQARTNVQEGALAPVGGGFLFFDKLHPSAQAHAQIAGEILDSLRGGPFNDVLATQIGSQAATTIPVGGTGSFAASLVAGRAYEIDALGVSDGAGSLADPLVRVLDASGAVLATDDDSGLGLDSHLRFVAPTTGDFTIQVTGVGVAGGSYRLQAGEDGGPNLLLTGALRGSDVQVEGSAGSDTIAALAGANLLHGGDGNDSIAGGTGFDYVNGNQGDDTIVGKSPGGDWLLGGQGDDLIDTSQSSGHNLIYGNRGDDTLIGGSGGDTIRGGQGDDIVRGGAGADWLFGDLGTNRLAGGSGGDTLIGGSGADTLRGGQGDDMINGGAGADWLSGDLGSNTLTGGDGADIFHGDRGRDLVTDFNGAVGDRILLDAGTTYTLSQVGADAVLDLSSGGRMTLAGVQTASLSAGWILVG